MSCQSFRGVCLEPSPFDHDFGTGVRLKTTSLVVVRTTEGEMSENPNLQWKYLRFLHPPPPSMADIVVWVCYMVIWLPN